jgi:DNA replication protein DnaC
MPTADFETLDQAFTQDELPRVELVTRSKTLHQPKTVEVLNSDGDLIETIPYSPKSKYRPAEWDALMPAVRAAQVRGWGQYVRNVDKAIVEASPPNCPSCNDMKWFLVDIDHPHKVVPCTDCPGYADKKSRTISFQMEVAGLPTARIVKRLDEINRDYQAGKGLRALERAYHLATTVTSKNTPKLLVLVGSTGVGKSFLSEGIAYEMVRQERQVFYVTGGLFADAMRPRFGADRTDTSLPGRQQFKSGLLKVDNLVFDEVGVGDDPFGSIADEYQDLFSRRFDKGLTTVIAGNIGPVYADAAEYQLWMNAGSPPGDTPVEKMSAEQHLAQVIGDRLVSRLKTNDGSAALASMWECRDARPLEKKYRGK